MTRWVVSERSIVAAVLTGYVDADDCLTYELRADSFEDAELRALYRGARVLLALGHVITDELLARVLPALDARFEEVRFLVERLRREGALERDRIRALPSSSECVFAGCGGELVINGECKRCERVQVPELAALARGRAA